MAHRRGRKKRIIKQDGIRLPVGYEMMDLTKENIPTIAARSGRTVEELELMRLARAERNGTVIKARYKVIEQVEAPVLNEEKE